MRAWGFCIVSKGAIVLDHKKSVFTVFAFILPLSLFAVPENPTNLILTPTSTTVSLHWDDNADNERGYKIYRNGVQIYTTLANVTTYHDSGLAPHTTYIYEVLATDDYLWYQPDVHTSWQWQLTESINQSYDVELYDIDLFDTPVATIQNLHDNGKKVICYFSAGSYEDGREDQDDFPAVTLGNVLDDWGDEKWLDIRANSIRPIMIHRLELAKQKGCDGVEPDNVDGYDNDTGFDLTPDDQLSYNLFLAKEAHERGLSIGLKNDLDQVAALEPFFDFAVNEECHFYNECHLVYPFIYANKPVLNAEYAQAYVDNTNGARDTMCSDSKVEGFKTLVLPLELDDSFRYSCPNLDENAQ